MKISIFTPAKTTGSEFAAVYAIANYCGVAGVTANTLICNGCLESCSSLMFETNESLRIRNCYGCKKGQHEAVNWAGTNGFDLSNYITPHTVRELKDFVNSLSHKELKNIECNGIPVYDLVLDRAFQNKDRAQIQAFINNTKAIKKIFTSFLWTWEAIDVYLRQESPDVLLTTSANDFIVLAVLLAANKSGFPVFSFAEQEDQSSILVTKISNSEKFSMPVYFSDISNIRADVKTWPAELLNHVEMLFDFVGIRSSAGNDLGIRVG